MPTIDEVEAVCDELTQRGETPSIEKVRRITGGSTRDIGRMLRQLRAPAEPAVTHIPAQASPKPALRRADLIDAAKRYTLHHGLHTRFVLMSCTT